MLVGGRRRRDRDREPLLRTVPLHRRAAPDGRGHPHRGAPRRRPRCRPAVGGARCGRPTSAPVRPWCWPGWSPTARPWSPTRHHVDRGYEDLAGKLRSLGRRRRAHAEGCSGIPRTLVGPCRVSSGATPPSTTAAAPRRRSDGDRLALARLVSRRRTRRETRPGAIAALAYRRGAEVPTVGITGPPGAGKSTLVTRLLIGGTWHRGARRRSAVIAVDPTSPFSGGAILGDRVRMQDHALDTGVFIRSMAHAGHLGGLGAGGARGGAGAGQLRDCARRSDRDRRCRQVEVEVASATDTTVVVVTPGWGDAVQANKAGLLEVADMFVINKADRPVHARPRLDLEQMLDMSHPGLAAARSSRRSPPRSEAWRICGEVIGRTPGLPVGERALDSADGRLEREFRRAPGRGSRSRWTGYATTAGSHGWSMTSSIARSIPTRRRTA